MTSKEALEKLINDIINRTLGKGLPLKLVIDYDYLIPLLKDVKQDLDRLEKLEKEHNKLKERYKHRAETSNDLCKAVKQYENAIEIIKEKKVDIPKLLANDFNNYNALAVFFGFKQLTQEEYELLKEVL